MKADIHPSCSRSAMTCFASLQAVACNLVPSVFFTALAVCKEGSSGGCVSGNHMWCGRCLVMPGVKRRPLRWKQTGHHVLKGKDTTRISGLGTPWIGCCCYCCFSVALAALNPRVIAAKDLDSTPKTLLTCRLPAASEDSTTHSGLVRPKRGRDGVGGGVGHGVRRNPTKPNDTAGPRFRSQWQAASFMHHR